MEAIPPFFALLYHNFANISTVSRPNHGDGDKRFMIFSDMPRVAWRDIFADAKVILNPCGFSDIIFATKTREANITRWKPNITVKQNFAHGEIFTRRRRI